MRKLLVPAAAILAMACGVNAQLTLSTLTGGTNQGNVGGGIYFDLQVNQTITINQIDWRCGATTVAGTGTIDIFLGPSSYVGNVANPAAWTSVAQATATVAPSTVSQGVLTTPLSLGPGSYGIALQSSGFSHGYTNGTGCSSNTIPGSCANSVFSNAELTLRGGAAQNAFLSGNIFTPRIWNGTLHYSLGGNPITVASWEPYGEGCYGWFQSYYQVFPNPAGLNLGTQGVGNPTSIMHQLTQDGYRVTTGSTPVAAPTSTPVTLNSNLTNVMASAALGGPLPFPIIHPDNTGGVGVASDLEICTSGYITPAPSTQPPVAAPTIGALLSNPSRWAPLWKNIDPSVANANFYVEVDPTAGSLNVTWERAVDTGSTGAASENTFQVAYFPNGDVEYRYGSLSLLGGGGRPVLIGWSTGNGALDPGNDEITTAVPFLVELRDNTPLTLESSDRPLLGAAINLNTTGISAGSAVGALSIGFTAQVPGIDLSFALAPGCFLHLQPNVTFSIPMAAPVAAFPIVVPNDPSLNGGLVFAQSISVAGGFNTGGYVTSNGLRLTLGSL